VSAPWWRRPAVLATGIVVLAGLLRLHGLGSWPWEQDELYTLFDATHLGGGGSGPGVAARPLYYLLQHALFAIGPATPLAMRIPPFLFGVFGVWLTWWVGRRTLGEQAGLVGALLLALSPWHLYASQFARYWTALYDLGLLFYWLYPLARDRDEGPAYVPALLVALIGAFTHPTFAFAVVGVVAAAALVSGSGARGFRLPSRREWLWFWVPLAIGAVAFTLVVKLAGSPKALPIHAGRGWAANLRVLLGMLEWMTPAVATAGALSAVYLATRPGRDGDARWGWSTILGCGSLVVLLLIAGRKADIYADYGMGMLPLIYLAIGGALQRVSERIASPWPAAAGAAVLVAATLPGVASHLVDGTRFDYRTAYNYIMHSDSTRLVLGLPTFTQRAYAPRLNFAEFQTEVPQLDSALALHREFWIVASYSRSGLLGDDGSATGWIDSHCRVALRVGRPRFDDRSYVVNVLACGAP